MHSQFIGGQLPGGGVHVAVDGAGDGAAAELHDVAGERAGLVREDVLHRGQVAVLFECVCVCVCVRGWRWVLLVCIGRRIAPRPGRRSVKSLRAW
jgi:hypothetical protein